MGPPRQGVVRGNPVGHRDCPAAVSGNDRRHTHWVRRTGPGKRRPVGVSYDETCPRVRRPATCPRASTRVRFRPCPDSRRRVDVADRHATLPTDTKHPAASRVTLAHIMSEHDTNLYGTIHGGVVMKLIDDAAAAAAGRHAHGPPVTASVDGMAFLAPVRAGDPLVTYAGFTGSRGSDKPPYAFPSRQPAEKAVRCGRPAVPSGNVGGSCSPSGARPDWAGRPEE